MEDITDLFYPIVMYVFRSSGKDHNLVDICVETLACIAHNVNWYFYNKMIRNALRDISKYENEERSQIRLICQILENFHFDILVKEEDDAKTKEIKNNRAKKLESLLPSLFSLTKDRQAKEIFSVPIYLALVKLFLVLPKQIMDTHLNGMLLELCGLLLSRAQLTRDNTRGTLIDVALTLGTEHFKDILTALCTLLKRGYQVHVLGYTIYTLLVNVVKTAEYGSLDENVSVIAPILLNDVMGRAAEQKEVKQIANSMKEAKHSKSYDSFRLLATIIDVDKTFEDLVDPVFNAVLDAHEHKIQGRLKKIMDYIKIGLKRNETITSSLLIYLKDTIDVYTLSSETTVASKRKTRKIDSTIIEDDPRKLLAEKTDVVKNKHLIVAFCLGIVQNLILEKHHFDDTFGSKLDPFVDLIFRCLKSRFDDILIISLKCLNAMISVDLPSLNEKMNGFINVMLKIFNRSGSSSPLSITCFKTMTIMLKTKKEFFLNDKTLTRVLGYISLNLVQGTDIHTLNTSLGLLKAIVWKRLLAPEIYDLMKKVSKLILHTHNTSTRSSCEKILIRFLINYPIGKKRMITQLDFIVTNITYVHATGREALISVLQSIFKQFPTDLLNQHSEYFFVPLTLALANDDSPECRKQLATTLKLLFRSIDETYFNNIYDMIFQWFTDSSKPELQDVAGQLIGHVIDEQEKKFERRIENLLPHLMEYMNSDEDDWKVLYRTLLIIEKLMRYPSFAKSDDFNRFLEYMCSDDVLLHSHSWIRSASNRIFGSYFSYRAKYNPVDSTKDNKDFLKYNNRIFNLCKLFCSVLEGQYVDQLLGDQIVKNLIFCSMIIFQHPSICERPDTTAIDEDEDQASGQSPLPWIFRRLSYMARRESKEVIKRKSIYQYFASMATLLDETNLEELMVPIMHPLYRLIVTDESELNEKELQLKELAEQVMELLQDKMKTSYFEAYEKVRSTAISKKRKRNQNEKFLAIQDPEAFAKKKKRKRDRNKENRKRKAAHQSLYHRTKIRKIVRNREE
eukprot:TRINITY_DN4251_c0_g2_i1.p1 TRINITY_DN4251_c0_g2~~TRINITY_DN4251_c0_g2_i1.p1  ORF type:complete len:1117 (-),score=239.60 TRINITY_DN4251_c0_g2_i1:71-3127(-)